MLYPIASLYVFRLYRKPRRPGMTLCSCGCGDKFPRNQMVFVRDVDQNHRQSYELIHRTHIPKAG